MELNDSQKKLIILLNHHVKQINKEAHDENFWTNLCNNFPNFVEESVAYRAIIETQLNDFSENMLMQAGKSWATNLEGVKYFVELFENDSSYTFIYTSALIKGFNLGKFAHFLNSHGGLCLPDHSLYESEIINLEFIKVLKKPKIISLKDLNKMISTHNQ